MQNYTTGEFDNVTTTDISSVTSQPPISQNDSSLKVLILCSVLLVCLGGIMIVGIQYMRRVKLDRLRHQLMPLYSFDPEECDDWESDLVDDGSTKAEAGKPMGNYGTGLEVLAPS